MNVEKEKENDRLNQLLSKIQKRLPEFYKDPDIILKMLVDIIKIQQEDIITLKTLVQSMSQRMNEMVKYNTNLANNLNTLIEITSKEDKNENKGD